MARRILMDSSYLTEESNYLSGGPDRRFVSSIRPDETVISQIEEANKGHVSYYTFCIVDTEVDETGNESFGDYLYRGPQIHRGEPKSIGESIFCNGRDKVWHKIDGEQIERFCVEKVGSETLETPMTKGDVTQSEYILMLMKYPELANLLEAGVEPVKTQISK